jgi:hypothetical protein
VAKHQREAIVKSKKKKCGGRTVKVEVTRRHIMDGETESAEYCAIALALNEAGLPVCSVGDQDIVFTDPDTDNEVTIDTPVKLAAFINKFDDTESVEIDDQGLNDFEYDEALEKARNKARLALKPFSFEVILPGPAVIKA